MLCNHKSFHVAPRQFAEEIVSHLDATFLEKTEIAGPGFINFYLKSDVIYDALANLLKAGSEYGNLPKQETPRIRVGYLSVTLLRSTSCRSWSWSCFW